MAILHMFLYSFINGPTNNFPVINIFHTASYCNMKIKPSEKKTSGTKPLEHIHSPYFQGSSTIKVNSKPTLLSVIMLQASSILHNKPITT
jgi:hypothetical protein